MEDEALKRAKERGQKVGFSQDVKVTLVKGNKNEGGNDSKSASRNQELGKVADVQDASKPQGNTSQTSS